MRNSTLALLIPVTSALTFCACGSSAPPATPLTIGSGDYVVNVTSDARTITLTRRGDTLLTFPSDAFEIGTVPALETNASYDPWWIEPEDGISKPGPPDGFAWLDVTAASSSKTADGGASIAYTFTGGVTATLTIEASATGRFAMLLKPVNVPAAAGVIAMIRLRPRASTTEAFYGLGEWGDTINHRGYLRPMQLEADFTLENASDENHSPVPLLIGTNAWGLFVESHRVGAFDVARKEPDLVEVTFGTAEQSAAGLQFHLLAADAPLDITKLYYDITGYPLLPAQWALGPWLWRDENANQAQVLDDIMQIRTRDLATSAIWFDRPYASAVNSFDWDPNKFTDVPTMLAQVRAMGLRFAVWHTPYLEAATGALLTEALSKKYFPPKQGILTNGWGPPIDFTNMDAYAWWQSLLKTYTDMGVEGFKLDYGEDIIAGASGNRTGWLFADGEDELTMHWGYTQLYHQVYAEMVPKTGGYLLCRAGRWGDQAHVSVMWPGDLDATWTIKGQTFTSGGKTVKGVGGFPTSIADGLSLGPSGFPFFASDTAGYIHSPAPKELWVRWLEQTALSAVMNVGDASSEQPWEFTADNGRDDEALGIYQIFARLHMRLFPYEWTYAQNISKDGHPITRAFGLVHPELGLHPSDIYFFGDSLLVAPIDAEGATARAVTVPPGDWIDWWDGTVYTGATGGTAVMIPAPLDKLPLLLKAGGIIPMLRPTIDTMSPTTATPDIVDSFATDPGILWVRLAAGAGTFTVYDGTAISQSAGSVNLNSGTVFGEGEMLEILNARPGNSTSVMLDGAALTAAASLDALGTAANGFFVDPAALNGTLWVKVPAGKHAITYASM